MLETAGDFVKAEIFRNAVHAPGARIGLKGSDQQFARVVFIIAAGIIVAQHRQGRVYALHPFEQHIIVLAGMERRGHTDAGCQIARPHTAANDHIVGGNRSFVGFDPCDPLAIVLDLGDLGIFKNLRAAAARALGQRLGDINRVGIAVAGNMDAADHILNIDDGGQGLNLFWADDMDRKVKDLGHGGAAFQLLKALSIGRHRDGAALAIASGLTGFGLQSAIELACIFGQLGHIDRWPQLSHQSSRVPGGAAGQLLTF